MTVRGSTEFTESFLQDQELLRDHRSGDGDAFGVLFEKYQGLAYSYARKFVTTQERAEDIVHESFTRILETIRRGKGPTISMQHYLVTTIRTVAIAHGILGEQEHSKDPEDIARLYEEENFEDAEVTADWLGEAFNRLDERAQKVMWMRVIQGHTSREVAKQLEISPVAVTRAYQAAVRQFKEEFVRISIADSSDPECRLSEPLLQKIARQQAIQRSEHIAVCPRCRAIVSRLRGSERSLLSIIFLVGLGTLAADSLKASPAANAASHAVGGGLSLPIKLTFLAVPLLGGALAVAQLAQMMLVASPQKPTVVTTIELGQISQGVATPLVSVGECGIDREKAGDTHELWRLSNSLAECNAIIEYRATSGSDGAVLRLDTLGDPGIRTAEIGRAGMYVITVMNGRTQQSSTVSVAATQP